MLTERDAMKRQSTVLMTAATGDAKLMLALLEVENLTRQLETEREEHRDKVARVLNGNVDRYFNDYVTE